MKSAFQTHLSYDLRRSMFPCAPPFSCLNAARIRSSRNLIGLSRVHRIFGFQYPNPPPTWTLQRQLEISLAADIIRRLPSWYFVWYHLKDNSE
jgi:hypothetical protein